MHRSDPDPSGLRILPAGAGRAVAPARSVSSIRARLTLRLLLAVGLLLGAGGAFAYVGVRQTLYGDFDAAMRTKAATVASLVEVDGAGVDFELEPGLLRDFAPGDAPAYYQIWLASGDVLTRSESLASGDLPQPTAGWRSGESRFVSLPDGRAGRAVLLRFRPEPEAADDHAAPAVFVVDERGRIRSAPAPRHVDPPEVTVLLAKETAPVERALHGLVAGFGVGLVLLALIGAVLVRWTVRAGLRPIDDLADAVSLIEAETLSERLPEPMARELRPIVRTLNGLLGRLEHAFDRERRFTSAAAHQLKTPIAELRTLSEVAMAWPDDAELSAQTLGELVDLAIQMDRIVVTLLHLARAQSDLPVSDAAPFELLELLHEVWAPLERRADERELRFRCGVGDDVVVETDRGLLAMVLTNLLDNAVDYAPEGGRIAVTCERAGAERLRLIVSNTTDGTLAPEDVAHLFEPFWRRDPSAAGGSGHVGLGLSLVKSLCDALGCEVRASLAEGELRFHLELPLRSLVSAAA